jgi:hypothetical protein
MWEDDREAAGECGVCAYGLILRSGSRHCLLLCYGECRQYCDMACVTGSVLLQRCIVPADNATPGLSPRDVCIRMHLAPQPVDTACDAR